MTEPRNIFSVRRENHFLLWLVIIALCVTTFYLWSEVNELQSRLEPQPPKKPVVTPIPLPTETSAPEAKISPTESPSPTSTATLTPSPVPTLKQALGDSKLINKGRAWALKVDKTKVGFPIKEENFDGSPYRFKYLDSDHDGMLTEEEYLQFQIKVRDERRRFDKNRDGLISPDEFGEVREQFDNLDENKDGYLDDREIGTALIKGTW